MTPTLDSLIKAVDGSNPDPLEQLNRASQVAEELGQLGDQLLTFYVDRCRTSGRSWSDIGQYLGVSRQAVQKRFADEDDAAQRSPSVERPRRDHRGKYRPLWEWLGQQRARVIPLTFDDIERVIGFPLPPSCREHQPHWHSYEGSAVVRAIIDAGYKARRVDLQAETLELVRVVP